MVLEFGKRIHQIELRKVAIYISFICGLIFICSSTAFADSIDNALTEQGQLFADPVSVNDTEPFSVQDTDAIIHQVSDKIAYDLTESGLLSDSGTKATDYVYSIYQYLQTTIHPDLTGIKNTLQNGIYADTSNIDTKLGNILQVLYGGATSYPSASTSIWYYLNGMYGMLIDGSLPSGGYGVLAQLPLIEQNLHTASGVSVASSAAGINQAMGSVTSTLSGISGKIDTVNSNISNIDNLNWVTAGNYTYTFKDDNYTDSVTLPTSGTSVSIGQNDCYIYYTPSLDINDDVVYKIYLPVRSSYASNDAKYSFEFIYNTKALQHVTYTYRVLRRGIELYLFDANMYSSSVNLCIHVSSDKNLNIYNTSPYMQCISSDKLTYFDILDAISSESIQNNIGLLTEELASEDMREAKKASQPVIDDTLENFTGNGSAAAKVSDTQAMKSVSSSLKSGLDAGGSISDALSVFDSSSSIWEWFSQSNSDDINNPSLQTRNNQLKSGSSDYVPDFYSLNQLDLLDLLGGK